MAQNKEQRLHPFLPTRDEVSEDPTLFYSDHVPQLLTAPAVAGESGLKILTYNIYAPGEPCGYGNLESIYAKDSEYISAKEAYYNREKDLGGSETRKLREAMENRSNQLLGEYHALRAKRIATSIKTAASENDLDIILLQEASPEQQKKIIDELGNAWEISASNNDTNLVCYYKKDRLTLKKSESETIDPDDRNERIMRLEFQRSKEPQSPSFTVINLSGNPHNDYADKSQLLTELTVPGQTTIIAGDFNTRTEDIDGPIHVTGLVPPQFNKAKITNETDENAGKYEIPDCTDGGVIIRPGSNMSMLPRIAIDPTTGKPQTNIAAKFTNPFQFEFNASYAHSIAGRIKKNAIDKITTRIKNIQKAWGIFIRKDAKEDSKSKVKALEELIKSIKTASPDIDLKTIIEDWERKSPTDNTKNYREIIHNHRRGREEHESFTKTEELIENLKANKP